MSKEDTIIKAYISKNEIFADAFNFLIYDGKSVIKAEELKELDLTEIKLPYENKEDELRDVLKACVVKCDDKAIYALFGVESRAEIRYSIAVQNKLCTSISYVSQIENAEKCHKGKEEDKLLPVITMTLYFGAEKWDGAESIHEMFSVKNKELLKFVSDYKINLIEPQKIKEEDFDKFKTGLGMVMQYIKHQQDEDIEWITKNKKFEQIDIETANLINALTRRIKKQ